MSTATAAARIGGRLAQTIARNRIWIPGASLPLIHQHTSETRWFSTSNSHPSDEHDNHDSTNITDGNQDRQDINSSVLSENPGLQSIIDQGLGTLKTTGNVIASKPQTKKPLFHKAALEDDGPTPDQLAEAQRVLMVAQECLEKASKRKGAPLLAVEGYSILLLYAQVNKNHREATIFWSLPFEILLEVDDETRSDLTERMQRVLIQQGGGKYLQKQVHTVLASYFPPKLKFAPASDVMLQQMLLANMDDFP